MAIYTYRLGVGGSAGAADVVLFTTISGQHVILRDLVFTNASGTAINLQISIRAAAAFIYPVYAQALAPYTTGHWEGRQEIRLGEELHASASGGPWSAAATGYVFQI